MTNDAKDECRIEHAQVCVRCDAIQIEKQGGLRGQICGKCSEELKELFKHWKKHGLYAKEGNYDQAEG